MPSAGHAAALSQARRTWPPDRGRARPWVRGSSWPPSARARTPGGGHRPDWLLDQRGDIHVGIGGDERGLARPPPYSAGPASSGPRCWPGRRWPARSPAWRRPGRHLCGPPAMVCALDSSAGSIAQVSLAACPAGAAAGAEQLGQPPAAGQAGRQVVVQQIGARTLVGRVDQRPDPGDVVARRDRSLLLAGRPERQERPARAEHGAQAVGGLGGQRVDAEDAHADLVHWQHGRPVGGHAGRPGCRGACPARRASSPTADGFCPAA